MGSNTVRPYHHYRSQIGWTILKTSGAHALEPKVRWRIGLLGFLCDLLVPFVLFSHFRSSLCLLNPETLEQTYQGIMQNGKRLGTLGSHAFFLIFNENLSFQHDAVVSGVDHRPPLCPSPSLSSSSSSSMRSTATSRRTLVFEFPMVVPPTQSCHRPLRNRKRTLFTEEKTIQDVCLLSQQYYDRRDILRPTLESRRNGESYASNFGSLYDDSSSSSTVSLGYGVEYPEISSQLVLPVIPLPPSPNSRDSGSASSESSLLGLEIFGRIFDDNRRLRANREPH
ncbi:hypothetical protein PIB30_028982 [Stylosanthes scabra]|uniref:Uncharacterized protein n=1 Tax=Stylosanthes scabra TaxID=79078 RepID=A0ABU6VAY1_9FABA|nr:hypothetical protein [Stylosanthes scabra]